MHTDTNDQIVFNFDESNNSNVKLTLNNIKATITKYDILSMGIEVFTDNNYLADILLIPNSSLESTYQNYSYQITIPENNSKVAINLSELFEVGSINSNLGYANNYYFEYYVDGEKIYCDKPGYSTGLAVQDFVDGIYNINIKMYLKYVGTTEYKELEGKVKKVKLSISKDYNIVSMEEDLGIYRKPSVSNPIIYDYDIEHTSACYSEVPYDIKYNKIVFDFAPKGAVYTAQYVLKVKNSVEDFTHGTSIDYYGIMVENENGFTKIYIRNSNLLIGLNIGELKIGEEDAWVGQQNVLEAIYVANNSYIVIRLTRGNQVIFEKKICQNVDGVQLTKTDIRDMLINTGASYTEISLKNIVCKVYKCEVGNKMLGSVDFINSETNDFISGINVIEPDTGVLISNADGTAYVSSATKFQIKFKALALDYYNLIPNEEFLRLVVVNNTARLMPMDPFDSLKTGDRGLYFSIVNKSSTVRELRMYLYKYDRIYKEQVVSSFEIGSTNDLLDGKEHILKIELTESPQTYTSAGIDIECYRIKVYIDTLSGAYCQVLYPVNNYLFSWLSDGATGYEPEKEYSSRDDFFVSEVNYSGIITKKATIEILELAVS